MMLLEGVRVIDWGLGQVGPYAAMLLGDLGADVIKVEPLDSGDFMRGLTNFLSCSLELPDGRSSAFEAFNRNKRSIAIDLSNASGLAVMRRLIEHSDVFVTNYRAPAAARLGLDYASLRELNDRLIYASSSCFGPEGPEAGLRGDDPTAQARIGMMSSCSEPTSSPHYVSPGSGDAIAAMMMASAVQGALYMRERTGRGQEVSVSQVSSLLSLLRFQVTMAFLHGFKNAEMIMPNGSPGTAHSGWFRCADGKWMFISAGWTGERGWRDICRRTGHEHLIDDPRFADIPTRLANNDALRAVLEGIFAERPAAEWERIFDGFEGNFARIREDLFEMADDEQMRANGYVVSDQHPALGEIKTLGVIPSFSDTPGALRLPPPELGQHTEEVLVDVLGYDWETVSSLKAEHAIN